MIDAATFINAMRQRRITWLYVAKAIGRADIDVLRWMKDESSIPPYIILTLDAVKHKLEPAAEQRMQFADVASALGIEAPRVEYWRNTRQYPLAARLAMTAYDYQRENMRPATVPDRSERLPTHQFRTLALIVQAGKYWRVTGGWRARPAMGKVFPKIKLHTPDALIAAGLIEQSIERMQVCLQPTAAGKTRFYGAKDG